MCVLSFCVSVADCFTWWENRAPERSRRSTLRVDISAMNCEDGRYVELPQNRVYKIGFEINGLLQLFSCSNTYGRNNSLFDTSWNDAPILRTAYLF